MRLRYAYFEQWCVNASKVFPATIVSFYYFHIIYKHYKLSHFVIILRYTGTPSPMSPTPSPAGSVGSVGSMGSQGSTSCGDLNSSQNFCSQNKLTNGVGPIATMTVPSRIMENMSRYLVFSNYSLYGLDFWDQSEAMAQDHQGKEKTIV